MIMGFFNWSVEEKLANHTIDTYHPLGVLTEYNEAELYAMYKALLGMYQEGVLEGTIEPYGPDTIAENETANLYLIERSQMPAEIVGSFREALIDLTQAGTLEVKHINPREEHTKAPTTQIDITPGDFTPPALKSVLDVDLPKFLTTNLALLGVIAVAGAIVFTQMRGANYGRA